MMATCAFRVIPFGKIASFARNAPNLLSGAKLAGGLRAPHAYSVLSSHRVGPLGESAKRPVARGTATRRSTVGAHGRAPLQGPSPRRIPT